jgi:hypothetical protein
MAIPAVGQVNAAPAQQIQQGADATIELPSEASAIAKEALKGTAALVFGASTAASAKGSKTVLQVKFPAEAPVVGPALDIAAGLAAAASSKTFNAFVDKQSQ